MKLKPNLSGAAIKESLLVYVDKIALGVAVLLLLAFAVGAARIPSIEANKSPDALKDVAKIKSRAIKESTFPEEQKPQPTSFAQQAQPPIIEPEAYALYLPWSPMFRSKMARRGPPPLLTVNQLQASGGRGAICYRGSAADAEPEEFFDDEPKKKSKDKDKAAQEAARRPTAMRAFHGVHPETGNVLKVRNYVVITGLVPYREQLVAFDEAFKNLHGTGVDKDQPIWIDFELQRAEVPAGTSTLTAQLAKDLKWETVEQDEDASADWVQGVKDVVSNTYTMPTNNVPTNVEDSRPLTAPLAPLVMQDWGPEAGHPRIPTPGSAEEKADLAPPTEDEAPEKNNKAGASRAMASTNPAIDRKREVRNRLFRFVDLTVEPNTAYVYRVRLKLLNPNYGQPVEWLERPELAADETILTAWSEPSPVAVSRDESPAIVMGTKKYRGRAWPWMRVFGFDSRTGQPLSYEMRISGGQGTVLNAKATVEAQDFRTKLLRTFPDVRFSSNETVIDTIGGRRMTKSADEEMYDPLEVVLARPDGGLAYRNELDDALVDSEHSLEEPTRPSAARSTTSGSSRSSTSGTRAPAAETRSTTPPPTRGTRTTSSR